MNQISDAKKAEIKEQAKKLLENFSKAMSKVKTKPKKSESKLGGFREESQGLPADEDFKSRFFSNAPSKEGDFILAEKKQW